MLYCFVCICIVILFGIISITLTYRLPFEQNKCTGRFSYLNVCFFYQPTVFLISLFIVVVSSLRCVALVWCIEHASSISYTQHRPKHERKKHASCKHVFNIFSTISGIDGVVCMLFCVLNFLCVIVIFNILYLCAVCCVLSIVYCRFSCCVYDGVCMRITTKAIQLTRTIYETNTTYTEYQYNNNLNLYWNETSERAKKHKVYRTIQKTQSVWLVGTTHQTIATLCYASVQFCSWSWMFVTTDVSIKCWKGIDDKIQQ